MVHVLYVGFKIKCSAYVIRGIIVETSFFNIDEQLQ